MLLSVVAAVFLVRLALDQSVERVDISGRFQRVQPLDVQKAVRQAVGNEGMVAVDLKAVSRAVQQIPWVDQATVARSWPRGLTVRVIEQTPVARWGEAGCSMRVARSSCAIHATCPPSCPSLPGRRDTRRR